MSAPAPGAGRDVPYADPFDPAGGDAARHMAEQFRLAADVSTDPRRAALARLATASRALTEAMSTSVVPVDVLEAVAARLESDAAALAAYPKAPMYAGGVPRAAAGPGAPPGPHPFFDHSPLQGRANPIAPPLRLDVVDGAIVGTARFGSAYEGPPGSVHGGWVAAAFDELLGMAHTLSGVSGMTAVLTVKYRRPTPLHQDLELRGEVVSHEGRKIRTRGTIRAGGELCAEGEGLFVEVDAARFEAMLAARLRAG